MGERLGIGIYKDKKLLAVSYHHWSGYADAAMGLLEENVIPFLSVEPISDYKDALIYAIRALEETGAAFVGEELEEIQKMYPEEKFIDYEDRNVGWISIGDEAKHIMDIVNEGIEIDLDKREFYFGSIGYFDVETCEGNYVPISSESDSMKEYINDIIKNEKIINVKSSVDPEHVKFNQIEDLDILLERVGNNYFTINKIPNKIFYAM